MSVVKFVNIDEVYDHPTLETLGIVQVAEDDGVLVVVKKGELTVGEKALYFPVGVTVKDLPEFRFLEDRTVEPKDFGEVQSQGLIIPVPEWFKIGRNPDLIFLAAGGLTWETGFFKGVKFIDEAETEEQEKLEKLLGELVDVADAIGADMMGADEVDEEVP